MEYAPTANKSGTHQSTHKIIHIKWEPPNNGTIKLNIDGAVKNNPGKGGLGGVFRDCEGQWLLGFCGAIPLASPLEAELTTLYKGIQLALHHNFSSYIETDAHEVVNMFLHGNLLHDNIIFECKSLLSRLGAWELHHLYRVHNWVADLLANEGNSSGHFEEIVVFVFLPVFAQNQWTADNLGTSFARKINIGNTSYMGRDMAPNNCFVSYTVRCNQSIGHGLD